MRQTRARAKLPGASPLMRGLDDKGHPIDAAPANTETAPPRNPQRPRTRIILHTANGRRRAAAETNPTLRRRVRIILHTDRTRLALGEDSDTSHSEKSVTVADRDTGSSGSSTRNSQSSNPDLSNSQHKPFPRPLDTSTSGSSHAPICLTTGQQPQDSIANSTQQVPSCNTPVGNSDLTAGQTDQPLSPAAKQPSDTGEPPLAYPGSITTPPQGDLSPSSINSPISETSPGSPTGSSNLSIASMINHPGSQRGWRDTPIYSSPRSRGPPCPHCRDGDHRHE